MQESPTGSYGIVSVIPHPKKLHALILVYEDVAWVGQLPALQGRA